MSDFQAINPTVKALSVAELVAGIPSEDLADSRFIPSSQFASAEDVQVEGITVSTADLQEGWAFVAVPGEVQHGARFSSEAAKRGASIIITDESGVESASESGLPILVVSNPRRFAGQASRPLFSPLHDELTKVGVTGTNGKTTTTYFVRAALKPKFGKAAVFGTLEIDTGKTTIVSGRTTHEAPVVHRSLAMAAQEGASAAVVEVSAHAMSLERVQGLHFDIALFTNLQHDHLDYYKDMDRYFAAKALLFEPGVSERAVVAVDDDYGRKLARACPIPVTAVQVLSDDSPQIGQVPLYRARSIRPNLKNGTTSFTLVTPSGASFEATSPVPGRANVQNAAIALVVAVEMGVDLEAAINSLASAPPIPGRMEWIPSDPQTQPRVLVDYGHTPEGVELLLETVKDFASGKIIAVFGTDGDRDASKRVPLAEVYARKANELWVTDENPRFEDPVSIRAQLIEGVKNVRPDLRDVTEIQTHRRDAIRLAIESASPGDVVVIAGKGPETFQEIKGVKHPFDDREVARQVLSSTNES